MKNIKFKYVPSHKTAPEDVNSIEYYIWNGNNVADILAVNASK
jgi:hypothetical protein